MKHPIMETALAATLIPGGTLTAVRALDLKKLDPLM